MNQVSGQSSSFKRAAIAAGGLVMPVYWLAMRCRNWMYDHGILATHDLNVPTISVGNITTGGTGKTPAVRWLAEKLAAAGHRPAILMRGYKSTREGISDERELLASALADAPGGAVQVVADPDRQQGAHTAKTREPGINVFILDDGFQHRKIQRDLNLLLIHAAQKCSGVFLRESISGLKRADAFLITHSSEVGEESVRKLLQTIRRHNVTAPTFRSDHVIPSLLDSHGVSKSLEQIRGRRIAVFCGIGSPGSFISILTRAGCDCAKMMILDDHYEYTQSDWNGIQKTAGAVSAEAIITTEKDWVKCARFVSDSPIPIYRAELSLRFHGSDENDLWKLVKEKLSDTAIIQPPG